MRCERFGLSRDPGKLARELRGLAPGGESVRQAVGEIIQAVRDRGDAALLQYTREFDTSGREPKPLQVTAEELDAAAEALDPALREALSRAVRHIGEVADLTGARRGEAIFDTHEVTLQEHPVGRAAVYVPGGRAPYPSTVLMGVVPALRAGVGEVVVCSPPGPGGDVNPVVLAACRLAGATGVFRMGGAQAIAALAYGTGSVAPVDVIVGPGNLYVQEAKRQVYGQVGVDGFAGPSDLVVIAGGDADANLIALDLMAQAEHGSGTLVVALSASASLLDSIQELVAPATETGATVALAQVADADGALAISESFAPEHLELIGEEAEALAPRVTRAGCLFIGAGAGTAFGDYIAGSNHILPTDGTARWASGLTPLQFRRTMLTVRVADAAPLARDGALIARAEGFELHARSMEARIRQNRPDAV